MSVTCSRPNNVSILHHFFDTTTFTVYVTAGRGPNLEIFGKQLRLKIADTFQFTYTHNVVNTCHIQELERFKNCKSNIQGHSRLLMLVPFDRTRDFPLVFHCNYISVLIVPFLRY